MAVFRYCNTNCIKYEATKNILHGSWLSDYKLPIKQIIKAIYLWFCGHLYTEIKKKCIMHAPVFVRLRKFLIKKIQMYWARNPIKLGSPNIIVQVCEMKLNHNVKAHRRCGTIKPTWVLTIIDTSRTPTKGHAEVIPNKDANTIVVFTHFNEILIYI